VATIINIIPVRNLDVFFGDHLVIFLAMIPFPIIIPLIASRWESRARGCRRELTILWRGIELHELWYRRIYQLKPPAAG
jgi:hypothetical protein